MAFHQLKLALINKVKYLKNYLVLQIMKEHTFFQRLSQGMYIQNYKVKVDHVFIFLNIFPDQNLRNVIHYEL